MVAGGEGAGSDGASAGGGARVGSAAARSTSRTTRLAAGPDLTAAATASPSTVAAGTASRFTARMCSAGDRAANGAYLSTMLPSVSYSTAAQPRGGSCRAVRYGAGVYLC